MIQGFRTMRIVIRNIDTYFWYSYRPLAILTTYYNFGWAYTIVYQPYVIKSRG